MKHRVFSFCAALWFSTSRSHARRGSFAGNVAPLHHCAGNRERSQAVRKLWLAAAQYFGTKGFLSNYDAKLTEAVTAVWAKSFDDPQIRAAAVHVAETEKSIATDRTSGLFLLKLLHQF